MDILGGGGGQEAAIDDECGEPTGLILASLLLLLSIIVQSVRVAGFESAVALAAARNRQ